MFENLRTFLFGKPLGTGQIRQERLSNPQGLAIFASDSLSSTAYATEEILLVLVAGGALALSYSLPIAGLIALLIGVVVLSYRQLIHAYPQGGGAYQVARDNLGEFPALVAAAALLLDYILTASVSIAAGTAAITSAFPTLYQWKVLLALIILLLLWWGNLRGIRESGKIFAIPTYLFIASIFWMLGSGLWRYISGSPLIPNQIPSVRTLPEFHGALTLFLLMRAFAAGCTALTGIEATSNGVQSFRPPEAKNASRTLGIMAVILATIFLGITFFAKVLGIVPTPEETVVSQIARAIFGRGPSYFFVQIGTMLILLLAANTPFAAFPRLGAVLAKDKYFPHQFGSLGARLVHTSGIAAIALLSGALLVFFRADTHRIIPLYAVGVFLVFTISQFAMVKHWENYHPHRLHRGNIVVNAIGGIITAIVFLIVFISKFAAGAWILVPAIALLIKGMKTVRQHYANIAEELSLSRPIEHIPQEKTVVLLVSGVHQGTMKAVEFVKLLNPSRIKAVHIAIDPEEAERIRQKWNRYVKDLELEIIASPYRDIIAPLIEYIENVERSWEGDVVIVALPEFVPTKWWHHFLHNQTARYLRDVLEHREDVIIVDVPYRLKK
jgi:amino acid transporter